MIDREDDWWRTADLGECPITLECFSTLGYPPFALYHPGKNHEGVYAYFDGLALASYIVSRGVFQNPLTRIELTTEDCRRLDRYLEAHCYSGDAAAAATIFRGSRVISVAEAFALRNSVHVESTTSRSDRNRSNERDRERIQVLQNTATAALAGLFVYGNDRRHFANETTQSVPQLRSETSALLNDWGYDLSRRVEDESAQGSHGYSVIDDDEVVAVASQRHAYQTVQEAFPPLGDSTDSERTLISPDDYLIERVRTLSVRDQNEQSRHVIELERAREQLLRQALERRKQRKKDRADRLARNAKTYASQKKEEEELERARKEIEAWRDDQWEKLSLLSEHEQREKKERQRNSISNLRPGDEITNRCKDAHDNDRSKTGFGEDEATIGDATTEAKKKAKAAAKRKRAKERKKSQKALEKGEAEKLRRIEAEKAQRAASTLKCGACGTGIPKPSLAFERFDQLFCTPKCARTAMKLVS